MTRKLTNQDVRRWYESLVTDVVRDRRIRDANIAPETAAWIQTPIEFASIRLGEGGVETAAELADTLGQWAPVAFVYLLWISIFSITQMLLTNTVEEKSNKLVEVLLSSVAPVDLMAGKILGIAATGITIVAAWLGLVIAAVLWLPGLFDTAVSIDLSGLITSPVYLASFIVYFGLGYLLYAALLCGIGSLANNLKEAQTLMMPIQLLLTVPLLGDGSDRSRPQRPARAGDVLATAVHAVRDDESRRISASTCDLRRHDRVVAAVDLHCAAHCRARIRDRHFDDRQAAAVPPAARAAATQPRRRVIRCTLRDKPARRLFCR